MFKAPSDPVQLETWRKAVVQADRSLTSDDYVCHLHFAPESIKGRDDVHPQLIEGAVPRVFPYSPAVGDCHVRQGGMSLASPVSYSHAEVISLHTPETTGKRPSSDQSFSVPQKIRKVVIGSVSAGGNVDGQSLFSELCKESDSLCPERWTSIYDSEHLCFARLHIVSGQAVITVSVSISKRLDVRVYHGGLPVSHAFPDHISTKDDIRIFLVKLMNAQVFVGSHDEHLMDTEPVEIPVLPVEHRSGLELGAVCNPPGTSDTDT